MSTNHAYQSCLPIHWIEGQRTKAGENGWYCAALLWLLRLMTQVAVIVHVCWCSEISCGMSGMRKCMRGRALPPIPIDQLRCLLAGASLVAFWAAGPDILISCFSRIHLHDSFSSRTARIQLPASKHVVCHYTSVLVLHSHTFKVHFVVVLFVTAYHTLPYPER